MSVATTAIDLINPVLPNTFIHIQTHMCVTIHNLELTDSRRVDFTKWQQTTFYDMRNIAQQRLDVKNNVTHKMIVNTHVHIPVSLSNPCTNNIIVSRCGTFQSNAVFGVNL